MPQIHFPETPSLAEAQNTERERMAETGLTHAELDTLLEEGVVNRHSRVVSGAFVFTGTRVPVYNLWDYLSAGDSLDEFLESFPTVPRPLAEKAIALVGSRFTGGASRS